MTAPQNLPAFVEAGFHTAVTDFNVSESLSHFDKNSTHHNVRGPFEVQKGNKIGLIYTNAAR